MSAHEKRNLLLGAAWAMPATTVTSYGTLPSWNAAVSGVSVIDFEGVQTPGGGSFQSGGQMTIGGMNIRALNSDNRLYWAGAGTGYGPSSNITTQPLTTQFDAFQLTPGAPGTAIAFDLANFRTGESVDITFRFVDTSTTTVGVTTLAGVIPTNVGQFFGFTADMAFDRVTIARTAFIGDSSSRGLWLDNIRTGDASVPEPATLGLAAAVLAALGARRGRRRANVTE